MRQAHKMWLCVCWSAWATFTVRQRRLSWQIPHFPHKICVYLQFIKRAYDDMCKIELFFFFCHVYVRRKRLPPFFLSYFLSSTHGHMGCPQFGIFFSTLGRVQMKGKALPIFHYQIHVFRRSFLYAGEQKAEQKKQKQNKNSPSFVCVNANNCN